jgi:hypothetical protein
MKPWILLPTTLLVGACTLFRPTPASRAHAPRPPAPPATPTATTAPPAILPPYPPPAAVRVTTAPAVDSTGKSFRAIIWTTDETGDIDAFDRAAALAKAAGATHMVVSDNLPRSMWEYEPPLGTASTRPADPAARTDPYPAWYVYRPSLFKIFPPPALQPYVPVVYSAGVADVLTRRCAVLRRHGLRGVFQANEPQVMPETLFHDHPTWRGPRVDQMNRSTTPHFSMCVDEPEVLALYRESMAAMLRRCPEIELFRFVTTDAGAGLCWSPGLYPGANGPAWCKDRPMADRVRGFLDALRAGAQDAGQPIELRLVQIEPEEWMIPTFSDPVGLARSLPAGTAINNLEAPGATPYMATAGWGNAAWTFFNPVRGIPNPAAALASVRGALSGGAPRLTVSAPRGYDALYAHLLELARAQPPKTSAEEAALLQKLATDDVGAENSETLVQVWQNLGRANEFGELLRFAYPSTLGAVHQRWLTRPFVPFPAELPPADTAYFRPYLFQAKGETQAEDLVDVQAMRLYKGWPGRMWVLNVYNKVEPAVRTARARLAALIAKLPPERRASYELLDRRLELYLLLCTNARNAVNYQAVLDYIKDRKVPPDENPPLGALETWDRKMILEIARSEMDNTLAVLSLLQRAPDAHALLEFARTRQEEDITLLGPDLIAQLQKKVQVMNAHWQDYNRLTTVPNP